MVNFPDTSKIPPEPGHRPVPSATSSPAPAPVTGAPPSAGAPLAPTGAPSTTGASALAAKPDKGHPPKVASEADQRSAVDYVERMLKLSAPATPEGQSAAMRLSALYRLMITGTGQTEAWGNRLDPISAARLILFCQANELDPSGNDIFVLGGRIYVSFAARLKIAHRTGRFEGFEVDRPMSRDERGLYAIPESALSAWISFARRSDCRFGFLGTGYVTPDDRNPVAKQFPLDMAQKRARANALELAFPADVTLSRLDEAAMKRVEVETVESRPATTGGAAEAATPPSAPATDEVASTSPTAEGTPPAAESASPS